MLVHAENIKTCLMYYFRFKRQLPCVDEISTYKRELADLLVMDKNGFWEVEIKTSKQDLIRGEKSKKKHSCEDSKRHVNKYFVCVPTELIPEAIKWVEQTNKKYGVIEFTSKPIVGYIRNVKTAKYLNKNVSKVLQNKMIKRLSSALINERLRRIQR